VFVLPGDGRVARSCRAPSKAGFVAMFLGARLLAGVKSPGALQRNVAVKFSFAHIKFLT